MLFLLFPSSQVIAPTVPVTGWQSVASVSSTWAERADMPTDWVETESGAQTWGAAPRQPTEWQS